MAKRWLVTLLSFVLVWLVATRISKVETLLENLMK